MASAASALTRSASLVDAERWFMAGSRSGLDRLANDLVYVTNCAADARSRPWTRTGRICGVEDRALHSCAADSPTMSVGGENRRPRVLQATWLRCALDDCVSLEELTAGSEDPRQPGRGISITRDDDEVQESATVHQPPVRGRPPCARRDFEATARRRRRAQHASHRLDPADPDQYRPRHVSAGASPVAACCLQRGPRRAGKALVNVRRGIIGCGAIVPLAVVMQHHGFVEAEPPPSRYMIWYHFSCGTGPALSLLPLLTGGGYRSGSPRSARTATASSQARVVVQINDLDLQRSLGSTSRTPRWAARHKFPPRRSRALLDIRIQVMRSARVNAASPESCWSPIVFDLRATCCRRGRPQGCAHRRPRRPCQGRRRHPPRSPQSGRVTAPSVTS